MRKPMPPHRTEARAILRGAEITQDSERFLRVKGTSLLVNRGIRLWNRYRRAESLVGKHVDVRIRHLTLDPGTSEERQVWDAVALGDVKENAK